MNFTYKYYAQISNNEKKDSESNVVILGFNNNSIDMLHSLTEKNCSVTIVYSEERFSSKLGINNYQNEDVENISNNLINYLNSNVNKNKKQILISSDDVYTVLLAFAKTDLDESFIYQNVTQEQVLKCSNKVEFNLLCKGIGIDAPLTFVISNAEDLYNIKNELVFPGIVNLNTLVQYQNLLYRKC